MGIEPEKFLCAFNAQGWSKFDAKKLEEFAKRHLQAFKPQETQENYCEDCHQTSNHIFHTMQLIDDKHRYNKDFSKTFHLKMDSAEMDQELHELVIIQCPNCGHWRVAI